MSAARYAFIMAGGVGSRLCLLSEQRAKPAVPFAGKYRIIDFTLSNCVNSGIYDVGVLTQYRPTSLIQHIGIGRPWDLDRTRGGVQVLQPSLGKATGDWYRGTADAIYQNMFHLRGRHVDEVLVLSGDHVYAMDYNKLYRYHRERKASMTVAVTEVPEDQIDQFGILETDAQQRVTGFKEKPKSSKSRLASMGVYLFDRAKLVAWLTEDAAIESSSHDFGKDLVPRLIARGEAVFAYPFDRYWQDAGTVSAYYDTNMEFARARAPIELDAQRWTIHTQSADRPPVKIEHGARVVRSLVANGCQVAGYVERSILSPGVSVPRGAVVRDSIIMHDTRIGHGAQIVRAIVDKDAVIGPGVKLGSEDPGAPPNQACPEHLSTGLTIVGKGARLPEGLTVGRNARIGAFVEPEEFTENVPDGGVIDGPESKH